ncbi:MAG: TrkH family potassium uptake protein [Candidatus Thermoplasmatota archaeon]|nr:TrkH family potassium uptake protein [Candidatus Thermoplasmatota archaeon]MBU1940941.1 TrkH family potassium uptake protein [Candidatus Thermoplasmatota archaeon]
MSDIKTVLRDLGGIFIIIGIVSLITLLIPIYFQEYPPHATFNGILALFITAGIYLLMGIPLYTIFRKADRATFKSAMVTAALGWVFISLIGSLPFWLIPYNTTVGAIMDPLSAYFESMSGWTGTGLTMVNREDFLPYTLQFWRSFIQWIGGVGVIVLTLSVLARPGTGSFVLYRGEARDQKTHPSVVSTVRTIWWIFLLYTIIGIIILAIIGMLEQPGVGMDLWQSINHAMTGIATGGFSVTDQSITPFGVASQIVIILLMIFGAIAFAAHYDLLKGRVKEFLSDAQFKAMIIIIILGIIGLTFLNTKTFLGDYLTSFGASAFQFISALTCTGFASVENLPSWTESTKLVLSFAMVIGGAAGSTAGGIKLFRGILLFNGVGWRIKRAISTPRRVFVHKLGQKPLSKDEAIDLINEAAIISFMWVILLGVGVIVIGYIYPDYSLGTVIFEVCSAQGNVGLTAGITDISMAPLAKAMLIINMWIGRLEIIPIIVLFKSFFGLRRNII